MVTQKLPYQSWKSTLKSALLVLALCMGLAVYRYTPFAQITMHTIHETYTDMLEPWGVWAPVLFCIMGGLGVAIGFPRVVLSALGGASFGFLWGMVYAHTATMVGCYLTFAFARWAGPVSVAHWLAGNIALVDYVNNKLKTQGFWAVVFLRQMPVSGVLTNMALGISAVRIGPYVLGSLVGLFPQTAIFAFLGTSVHEHFWFRTLLSIGLVMGLAVLPGLVLRSTALDDFQTNKSSDDGCTQ